ncbi:MAG: CRTAC1 family protein [Acidobacteriota bacterium]
MRTLAAAGTSAALGLALTGMMVLAGAALGADDAPKAAPASADGPRFVEVSEAAGVRFAHASRQFTGPHAAVLEMFTEGGAIVAAGDVDSDGDDDLYLITSGEGARHHLYRNDGPAPDGAHDGLPRFVDIAEAAGVAGGNGEETLVSDALFLDYDNDGRLDLLAARLGAPILYRNTGVENGVPRFVDVTAHTGLAKLFANTFAVITFDADADGHLDLLLGHYFPAENLFDLGTPNVLPNDLDRAINGGGASFWQNVADSDAPGGRTFVNRTKEAGFAHHTGWTLDLGHADLDNDGDQDVYLAGDYGTDRLFMNRGDGTFDDTTETAIGWDTKKGMNVDMGDYDRDGYLDVYVTNITDEYMKECNMLWNNQGDGTFVDLSRETGTCDTDWGWAAKFADYDNDGWEDLFAVNGMRSAGEKNYIPVLLEMILTPNIDFSDVNSYPDIEDMTWSGYQKQRFFHNLGDGTFRETAGAVGLDNDWDGRGVAVLDMDDDGRLDLYQASVDRPARLFRNVTPAPGQWIGFALEGAARPGREGGSNRQAIGARVLVHAGGEIFLREVNGGNGFSSQSTLRLHVGLGALTRVDRVEVHWPSGLRQTLDASKHGFVAGAIHRIAEPPPAAGDTERPRS